MQKSYIGFISMFALAGAASAAGCALPLEDGDEMAGAEASEQDVATTSDALSVLFEANLAVNSNSTAPVDLGSASNRTCFLNKLKGRLFAQFNNTPAEASVYISGGRWWMKARAGDGGGISMGATCIDAVSERAFTGVAPSPQSQGVIEYILDAPGRQCFLTTMRATSAFTYPGSGASIEPASLWIDGSPTPVWRWYTSMFTEQDNTPGGYVGAVCVKLTGSQVDYSWTSPTPLVLMSTQRSTCGFTKISGNWAYTPGGTNDGVQIYQNRGSWKTTAFPGLGTEGTCIQGRIRL